MKRLTHRIRIFSVVLAAAMSLTSAAASANGFYIQEMTAPVDRLAPWSRPAGPRTSTGTQPTVLKGFWFEAGLTTFIPISWYRNDVTGVKTYASTRPSPCRLHSPPIGLTTGLPWHRRPPTSVLPSTGQRTGRHHKIISSSMQTFTINPNIAFGPFKGFSIGVGFDDVRQFQDQEGPDPWA